MEDLQASNSLEGGKGRYFELDHRAFFYCDSECCCQL